VNPRILIRIAVGIAAVGYFSYGYLVKPRDTAYAAMAAPISAHATEFTLGRLHFESCELPQKKSGATTKAFCAPFQIAENAGAPEGRKIDLKLALIRSDAEIANSDIVVYLAGGPGQSAIDSWPQIAGALAPLRRHHHILLLDQRGTGGSNPLLCAGGDAEDVSADGDNVAPEIVRKRMRDCLATVEKKADPRFYTTTDAVADLEAVRQAMGAPLFDLIGVSYGTRVAQQFLMRHPDSVRATVLDSVAPNELVLGEDFAVNLEQALKAQFSLCTQTPACAKAFGDPYANLASLRQRLHSQPADFEFRDPLTFASRKKRINDVAVSGLVRMFAYTPETAALLPLSIAEANKGNLAPLAGQTQALTEDLSELSGSGMQMSVICSEDADLLTSRPQDAGLALGTSMIDALKSACEVWPHGTRPADFHAALKTDKPVLVLEGELDPVTPPRYGEQVMQGLANGRLLVAKGQAHFVIGRGCMPKLVDEFVAKLNPKTLDAKCVDAFGPMPAYVNFNGASP
jgi:pimeloyl-ACP methyl ester carboxylesterase